MTPAPTREVSTTPSLSPRGHAIGAQRIAAKAIICRPGPRATDRHETKASRRHGPRATGGKRIYQDIGSEQAGSAPNKAASAG